MAVPLFNLDATITGLYRDGIDTIITVLGPLCKLVLPGDRAECPNCHLDVAKGRSSGVYKAGGPRAFTRPPCPVCNGTGYDPATLWREEVRHLSINRNPKPDPVLAAAITAPGTLVAVKGFAADIPLVLQADHLVLDYEHAVYAGEKYRLLKDTRPELTGSIVAGRYFRAFLQRVQ